jgi:hypothetical protein
MPLVTVLQLKISWQYVIQSHPYFILIPIFQASRTDLVQHEITVILSRRNITDENSFYSKVVESILNGSGTLGQVLEDELSDDEIATVMMLFDNNMIIASSTKPSKVFFRVVSMFI